MIFDSNLIAYEYYKNQYVPREVYPSGEREETKLIDKYGAKNPPAAILTLEDDIVNEDGYGLTRGFYNVVPDKYLDFLLIYQGGKLKAKVPVVAMEVFETNNPKQQKVKKMSASRYKRQQEKEYRKFLKGENPAEIEWSEVQISYSRDDEAWLIIYNSNNIELCGMIKF